MSTSAPHRPLDVAHRGEGLLFLTERADGLEASFGEQAVRLRGARPSEERAEVDGRTEDHVDRRPTTGDAAANLRDEIVAEAVDEDRNDRNARLVNDATDAALGGQERVRIAVSLSRALGVEPDEEAATTEQRRDLVEAREVEHGATALAEDGRIHREEAHRAVHERPQRIVVEE